jgi:hypothetical protein
MKIKNGIIVLFCMALVILFIIIYVYPNVTGALKKTEIIEYGSLQITDQVTAYIVRSETVYFADKSGSIQYNAEEGEQVRKGAKVLDIIPGSQKDRESSYQKLMERISRFNGGESLFSDDIKKIRAQIVKLESDSDAAVNAGEQDQAARLEKQLLRLRQKLDYIQAADAEAKEEIVSRTGKLNESDAAITISAGRTEWSAIISTAANGIHSGKYGAAEQDKVQRLNIEVQNLARETTLANEPLYKIVDNKKWYACSGLAP